MKIAELTDDTAYIKVLDKLWYILLIPYVNTDQNIILSAGWILGLSLLILMTWSDKLIQITFIDCPAIGRWQWYKMTSTNEYRVHPHFPTTSILRPLHFYNHLFLPSFQFFFTFYLVNVALYIKRVFPVSQMVLILKCISVISPKEQITQ